MTASLYIHQLIGCAPTPLAHYLKALGILRLVADQKDPMARGWWQGEHFALACTLDADSLECFFLNEYQPTPILAPWNGGSGFYPKDKKNGIDALRSSRSDRFARFREAIQICEQICSGLEAAPKDEPKFALIRRCRDEWRGSAADWLDAALVLLEDGSPAYPSLLGTGGNDGRLDFTNNFMQRLADLFELESANGKAHPGARLLLRGALWDESVNGLNECAVGQFFPGAVGGANGGNGFEGRGVINPWDFVLMMEGSIHFRASIVRRADLGRSSRAAAPFAVASSSAGYGSAAAADEGARGEQWMPLWSTPATSGEISDLLREGRNQVGRRPAARAVDFVRSIGRLGVARGLTAFERYAFIERNGQANLATPLGRWTVAPRPHQDLIDQIAPWVAMLRRKADSPGAPTGFSSIARRCEDAMLACCSHGTTARRWQYLLIELGRAELFAARSPRFALEQRLRPLPLLDAGWVDAIHDGSSEVRIAMAIAASRIVDHASPRLEESLKVYWLPIRGDGTRTEFDADKTAIRFGSRQVAHGGNFQSDCIAALRRRALEATRAGAKALGIRSLATRAVDLGCIAELIDGTLDESLILELALPLMALEWSEVSASSFEVDSRPELDRRIPGPVFGALKLALPLISHPRSLVDEFSMGEARLEPAVIELLATGNLSEAIEVALRRARSMGLRPKLRLAAGDRALARRMASALLVPLSDWDLTTLVRSAIKPDWDSTSNQTSLQ